MNFPSQCFCNKQILSSKPQTSLNFQDDIPQKSVASEVSITTLVVYVIILRMNFSGYCKISSFKFLKQIMHSAALVLMLGFLLCKAYQGCCASFHFCTNILLLHRLIAIGEEFCGSKSETLHDSIRTQTVNYFKNYHRSVQRL